jgi:hypothetical protein
MGLARILRLRVHLGLDYKRPLVFLSGCNAIYTGLNSNSKIFVTPNPLLPVLLGGIQDATMAHQNVATVRGGAAVRNAKFAVLRTMMESELAYVQSLCDASPELALTIINAAAMKARNHSGYQKPLIGLKNALPSGTVLVYANAKLLDQTRRSKFYNWQYTLDGGKTLVAMPPTQVGQTSLSGLTPLAMVGVQVSVSVHKEPQGPWSHTATILVR